MNAGRRSIIILITGLLVWSQIPVPCTLSATAKTPQVKSYKKAFERGAQQFYQEHWQRAVEYMRMALRLHAIEGSFRVTITTRVRPVYYPGLYLELALCECNEEGCGEAIEEWLALRDSESPMDVNSYLNVCPALSMRKCRVACRSLVMRYAKEIEERTLGDEQSWESSAQVPIVDIAAHGGEVAPRQGTETTR